MRESVKLLGKEWYEDVTAEELDAVKAAMVSGPQGINTHSGHWYNCVNGHPVGLNGLLLLQFTNGHSLRSVNVVCRWSSLAVLNVVPL